MKRWSSLTIFVACVHRGDQALARQHSVENILSEFKSIAMTSTGGTAFVFVPKAAIELSGVDEVDWGADVHSAPGLPNAALPSQADWDVPWSLVRYAVGCGHTVLVDDVTQSNFASDPYFLEHPATVRLCNLVTLYQVVVFERLFPGLCAHIHVRRVPWRFL